MRHLIALLIVAAATPLLADEPIVPLPGTRPLEMQGDIAMQLVEGVDRFLLKKISASAAERDQRWPTKFASDEARAAFLEEKREKLAHILGMRDERVLFDAPELVGTTATPALVGECALYNVYAVRWPTVGDMFGDGLLCVPNGNAAYVADVIVLPDADQTPEQIAGLTDGVERQAQTARRAAEYGCRVLVPTLISRRYEARKGRAKMTNREFIYRPAFELGRHPIGYELQQVLAGVDWFARERRGDDARVGVIGYGEGGLLALYAAALDPRIGSTVVAGYFGPKEQVWSQPIDRNVFGILTDFGDAEVAAMVAGKLHIDGSRYPQVTLPSEGGAPGELKAFAREEVMAEFARAQARQYVSSKRSISHAEGDLDADELVQKLLSAWINPPKERPSAKALEVGKGIDPDARQARLLHAMDRHSQWLLSESPYVRQEFFKGLDASSPEAYARTLEGYREKFRREVIGWFDDERLPAKPRSRKIIDAEKYTGYEVVLDVWPEVIAYGILLMPKQGEGTGKRPVVVCQHGLEGRPQDIVQGDHPAYHDFAAKLAERGFITFSPQNLYIGKDKFRTLQRKANPLGKTLFSIIIPQHQQIVDWLKTLPEVDEQRIAFYGLSYGGKSAMRIPPLVPDYCLSICSADFNEWVWKNASTRSPYSYVWTGEYEIFEFDLGSTFNYAEMAALIAPRPFMVERGHFDGVAPDETVGHEFAKVYRLYNAQLKMGDRCEIEWFAGPHTINGQGTFRFLHKHLEWPEPAEAQSAKGQGPSARQ